MSADQGVSTHSVLLSDIPAQPPHESIVRQHICHIWFGLSFSNVLPFPVPCHIPCLAIWVFTKKAVTNLVPTGIHLHDKISLQVLISTRICVKMTHKIDI